MEILKHIINDRKIPIEVLDVLKKEWLVSYHETNIQLPMRNLDWNTVGTKIRNIPWIEPKSKNTSGSGIWYFYTEIDYSMPIIITEWEIDWMTGLKYWSNIIGIPWINNLVSLINEIRKKSNTVPIYLLVDNDEAADNVLHSIIENEEIDKENIYDVRKLLGEYKDLNEMDCNKNLININDLEQSKKNLKQIAESIPKYFLEKNWSIIDVDAHKLSKYLKTKYDLAYANSIIYRYFDWLRHPLNREKFDKMILETIESDSKLFNNDKFRITWKMLSEVKTLIYWVTLDEEMQTILNTSKEDDIQLSDKIYNIMDNTLRDYTKKEFKINRFPYSSNDVLENPKKPENFLKFLDEILFWYEQKDEIINLLQEFIWYLFVPSIRFQKSLFIYWKWWNGKWTLLSIIQDILGKENCSALSLHEFDNNQNLYLLSWKLVNIDFDMKQKVQLDSAVIKRIISWEPIVVKVVYAQPIQIMPIVRIIIASNDLPKLENIDNSVHRRFIFLEIKRSFNINEQNTRLKDGLLKESKDIFAWWIAWLRRLIERWRFIVPEEININFKNFIDDEDVVEQFLLYWWLKKSEDNRLSCKDIYSAFRLFCEENGYVSVANNIFFKRLKSKWYKESVQNNNRWYIWLDFTDMYER